MRSWLIWVPTALVTVLVMAWWLHDSGDPRLRGFVIQRPVVDVVFTSRLNAASFEAAAPDGAQYVYPGKPLWQSPEGRLRLLSHRGHVYELTWNRPLPDGGTLIDVMSPAVTPDGQKIIFGGRRNDDHGHFRLYEVGVDGSGLRPLTGEADDPGCTAVPPMRWRTSTERELLSDSYRRQTDYDDVDPAPLPDGRIAFISSRTPDLGRDHARRVTNLWMREVDGQVHPLSANRNNDRWPFLTTTGQLIFSHWSRNREVVSGDGRDIVPWRPDVATLTEPTDDWMAALAGPAGDRFGHSAKTPWPVWRPRMLFNGRLICMTRFDDPATSSEQSRQTFCTVQMEPGSIYNVPSALARGDTLPNQLPLTMDRCSAEDDIGRTLETATPAPFPPAHVVFAGRPQAPSGARHVGDWALFLAIDDWARGGSSPGLEAQRLFDDPQMVDAEPVAVYRRSVMDIDTDVPKTKVALEPIQLHDGSLESGPAAYVDNAGVFMQQNQAAPGQTSDRGEGPIFAPPPSGAIERLRIYAAERDLFDDPQLPRIEGQWRTLLEMPLNNGRVAAWIPIGQPTVLAGIDSEGHVAQWTTAPQDSQGRQATFFAYAGDHYSGGKPGGITMCLGCHPGHSGIGYRRDNRDHRER